MRRLGPKLVILAAVFVASLALAAPALAVPAVSGIFPLKTEIETNNKIVQGPDGNMWFTLAGGKTAVGKITPSGVITEFELKGIENPIGIAPGPEGRLWVVATGKAASFLPTDPKGTEEDFESALINGNANIVQGPDKNMWVASAEKVAKFSPADFKGTIKEVPGNGTLNTLSPRDIDVAGSLIAIADANLTAAEKSRIVTLTTAGTQKDVLIPGASQGLAGGPGGQIAFGAPGANPEQAGLIPAGGAASAFTLTGDPFGVTFAGDGAYWIAQFGPPAGLTRVTTGGAVSRIGGFTEMTPRQIAAGPGNTLWVTLIKNEGLKSGPAIARVSGLEADKPPPGPIPAPPAPKVLPTTKLGKKPQKVVRTTAAKAAVKFGFSSSTAGANFECSLGHRVKSKGKKARFVGQKYGGCKSPKSYRLKPGRYRFGVRAVSASLRDASPATFGFKVVRIHKSH